MYSVINPYVSVTLVYQKLVRSLKVTDTQQHRSTKKKTYVELLR